MIFAIVTILMLLLAGVPTVLIALAAAFAASRRLREWRFARKVRRESEHHIKQTHGVRFIPNAKQQAAPRLCNNPRCAAINRPYARFCRVCGTTSLSSKEVAA